MSIVKRVLFCLVLTGLGVAGLYGTRLFVESREPLLDFSDRIYLPYPYGLRPKTDDNRLRFAVATMVSAEETYSTYRRLVRRICRDVGRSESPVIPSSYSDVRRSLEQGKIDVAFVCTGTYVKSLEHKRVKLLVQPEFEEGLLYQCLIIVPARSRLKTFEDLRGAQMAFTDRESNTGCFVPLTALFDKGYDPKTFLGKVVFTRSHDRSILAVARSQVEAAAVDSLVWESKRHEDPSLSKRVRVIWKSEVFGPPPIVVPIDTDPELEEALRKALLELDTDDEGREILSSMGIKRFIRPRLEDYRSAVELYRRFEKQGGVPWP